MSANFWPIPHDIIRRTDLTAKEKLILAVVYALDRTDRGCICSNAYLAQETGTTANAIKCALVRIRKKGLLEPLKTPFPRPVEGARLVPARVSKRPTRCQNETPQVSKRDIDREYIVNEREKTEAFESSSFPDPKVLAASIPGHDPATAEAAIRELYRLHQTTPHHVKHWPSYAKQYLDKAAAARQTQEAKLTAYSRLGRAGKREIAPPVSQFSRSY